MSAILEFTERPPKEVWLVSRDEPVRKRVLLTRDEEEKIINSSRYEIVDGEIRERAMPNPEHARIEAKLSAKLTNFVEESNLGVVYSECHFELAEKLTRVPDVAFVSFERFPESGESKGSKWQIAPDLAIEIISPTDDYKDVFEKLDEYFVAGVKQVWLVEPERKVLTVYYSQTRTTILTENDELICEAVLPGFWLRLKEIFQMPKPR